MMKKIIFVFICFTFLFSCREEKTDRIDRVKGESYVSALLKGEHKLHGLSVINDSSVFVGDFFLPKKDSLSQRIFVYFSWEMNDGSYAISFLPIEKIRINLVENQDYPSIKFRWRVYGSDFEKEAPLDRIMERNIIYAIVNTKK